MRHKHKRPTVDCVAAREEALRILKTASTGGTACTQADRREVQDEHEKDRRMEHMNIQEFADKHSVKVKRDDCNDVVIMGRRAAHIYDGFADGRLGLFVSLPTVRQWNSLRKKLEAAGMTTKQSASTEGCLLFDPTNSTQARLALKVVGARTRRYQRAPSVAQMVARQAFADRRRNSVQAA